jgi:putative FmdB family regulatory protein
MPIYEYRCESCESHFDVLQRAGEEKKDLRCPKCGHEKVEKQFSAFATSGGSSNRRIDCFRAGGVSRRRPGSMAALPRQKIPTSR